MAGVRVSHGRAPIAQSIHDTEVLRLSGVSRWWSCRRFLLQVADPVQLLVLSGF
jgi:hypothetical protein